MRFNLRPRLNAFAAIAGAALPTYSAWNPADKAGTITLSGSDRIATNSGALGNARSLTSRSTGRWQFEVTIVTASGSYPAFGVGNASESLTNYVGGSAGSIGYFPVPGVGDIYQNTSVVASIGQYTTGTFGVFVNATTRQIFFRHTSGILEGPYSITATGALFAMASLSGTASLSINTGQEAFQTSYLDYAPWG